MATASLASSQVSKKLDYRTVWRWHFYAGLFCIPFVIWLSITGSIYAFKPQIDDLLDRPYDNLAISGQPASPAAEAQAAVAAVPGSTLRSYELPRVGHSAVRVIVGRGKDLFRVYVHPQTLQILKIRNEDTRFTRLIFHLHGELLMGDRGSLIVELAASWTIIMLLTGIYLWWPRQIDKLAGIVYPRISSGQRIFWRDLHAVTGLYVIVFAMFLLLSGLPWAKSWGGLLKKVRATVSGGPVRQDWTTGRSSELAERQMSMDNMAGMSMEHAEHMGHMNYGSIPSVRYDTLDRLVPTMASLKLAYPVLISPPVKEGAPWTGKSDAQNRPQRVDLTLDGKTGEILSRQNFAQRSWLDRVMGYTVAAHEGQLFGLLNQLLELFTASCLVLMSVSAVVLWWRRRAVGVLGAPIPVARPKMSVALVVVVLMLGLYLPAMGVSLLIVLLLEKLVLSRIRPVCLWLGLRPAL